MKGSGFMDIAALSMSLNDIGITRDVNIALMKKAMELNEVTMDNMTQMMEISVNPQLGQNIDVTI